MSKAWPIITTILTVLGLSALFGLRVLGMYSHQALAFAMLLALLWGIVSRLWWWKRGTLHGRMNPSDREHRFQALGRGFFWLLIGATAIYITPRSADEGMIWWFAICAGLWIGVLALQLLQPAKTNRGPTVALLMGSMVILFDVAQVLRPTVDPVIRIAAPFAGEWEAAQGGRGSLESHHLSAYNQAYAIDFLQLVDGKIWMTDEAEGNESLHCWEAPLYAPVQGTVVIASDTMEDSDGANMVSNQEDAVGNTVVIETEEGLFVVFAHLRQGSVTVSEGEPVTVGDPIGKVGNSGNTTVPHLHFQIQTHKDVWDPDNRSVPFAIGDGPVLRRNDRVTGVANPRG